MNYQNNLFCQLHPPKQHMIDSDNKIEKLLQIGLKNFESIIQTIDNKKTYEKALREANKKYDIKNFKVLNMTPVKAKKIYPVLLQKYRQNLAQQQSWLENERRLFIWLVLCYLFVSQKGITDLSFQELSTFSSIFNMKKQDFLKFQIFALIKKQKTNAKWSQQQDKILLNIITKQVNHDEEKQWNDISKTFFHQSGQRYYRSSKQCRQRWMNHLDPNKIKGSWTNQHDLVLLKFVKEKGKKWSQIVKDLDGCKTQHMVKNRFNSLVNRKGKQIHSKNQDKIINRLIEDCQFSQSRCAEQEFKTSSKQAISYKSKKSIQGIQAKSQKNQQVPNIFQFDNAFGNGKACKFFVQRAGSLSMSQKGGVLPDLANPILQEMDSQQQKLRQKFYVSTPISERGIEMKSPFLGSSPFMTGNAGNITPSIFLLQQKQKGNNLYSSDFSLSFSSNFDKFIPQKQESG